MTKPIFNLGKENLFKETLTDRCIVLDLDSTLIYTLDDDDEEDGENQNYLKNINFFGNNVSKQASILKPRFYKFDLEDYERKGDGTKDTYMGVFRPGLKMDRFNDFSFVDFCFNYFKYVVVYSAGSHSYVNAIVSKVFTNLDHQPHAIFSYDNIVKEYDSAEDEREQNDNYKIIKPLERVINSNEIFKRDVDFTNILALDDLDTTFERNIDNGVLIPAYNPNSLSAALDKDDCLEKFAKWLMTKKVLESRDLRELKNKDKIFLD